MKTGRSFLNSILVYPEIMGQKFDNDQFVQKNQNEPESDVAGCFKDNVFILDLELVINEKVVKNGQEQGKNN